MPDDTADSSLSERVRSLHLSSPDLREFLLALAERVEQATAVEAVLARADGPPPPPPSPPERDRHGLRVIPGGLAAFAPLALLLHGGGATVATLTARLLCRSRHAQVVAAAAALSVGAALLVPVTGAVNSVTAGVPPRHAGAVHDNGHPRQPGLRPPAAPRRHRRRRDEDDEDAYALRGYGAVAHGDLAGWHHPGHRPAPRHRHGHRPPRWGHRPAGTRRTSSVRKPGPRRDEGRTVTAKHAVTSARRVARGRASNCLRVMPACASRRRPAASRPASSRSSASRVSMPSRRARSRCSRCALAGSAMAASASPRWAASAANCAARPGACGTWPGGLAGWLSRSTVRWVT